MYSDLVYKLHTCSDIYESTLIVSTSLTCSNTKILTFNDELHLSGVRAHGVGDIAAIATLVCVSDPEDLQHRGGAAGTDGDMVTG